jgi:hypothetical protein
MIRRVEVAGCATAEETLEFCDRKRGSDNRPSSCKPVPFRLDGVSAAHLLEVD